MKNYITFYILFISISVFSQNIEKMEPPFWWADMHLSDVQIVFYGTDIAQYDVQADKGTILQVRKTENPNYIFIELGTKGLPSTTIHFSFYKLGIKVTEKSFELKKRKENSRNRKSFDTSDAIYLIMPDRFANGDPSNDSHPDMAEKVNRTNDGGRHGGDIQGIIDHLDYIKDLGFTALWSTPLLEDNEPVYSYHTYAQSDYYKIDPRYGTNEAYKQLAATLHQKDMKLIMDYVTNHWGSKHWMIQDLPTRDWIHIWENGENGFQRSNYRMTTQFDPQSAQIDADACMNGWFDTTMPDMNQANPLLVKYMITNAIWWIEYADLDGLRVDTYSYNDKKGIAAWTKAILDEYPYFNIVGEVWMHDQAQISYWQKDSPIGAIQGFNSYCPSVMDFTLYDAFLSMFGEDEMQWNRGMQRAYDNFSNDFLYADPMNLMIFGANHDTSRINSILGDDIAKYKLFLTLITTMRGYPQFYYGDELGMLAEKSQGDGKLREDFPGGWVGDENNAFELQGRTKKQEAYYAITKKLFQWRKNNPVIHEGKFKHFVPIQNVYCYFRYTDTECVMTIINNSNLPQEINWQRFSEATDGYDMGVDIISDKAIKIGSKLLISSKTSMIIAFKK